MHTLLNEAIETTLNGAINATQATLTVVVNGTPPAVPFRIWIEKEMMRVTVNGGSGNYTVVRGIEGTTASSHASASKVLYPLVGAGYLVKAETIFEIVAEGGAGAPDPHAPTHYDGGSDPVDVTQLDGFTGSTSTFLRGDGSFATPPTGGGSSPVYTGEYYAGTISTALADAILALSPVAFWKCDETSGNFADSSGNGFNLTKDANTQNAIAKFIPTVSSKLALGSGLTNDGNTRTGTLGLSTPVNGDLTFAICLSRNPKDILAGRLYTVFSFDASGETEATNIQFSLNFREGLYSYIHEYSTGTNELVNFGVAIDTISTVYYLALTRNSSTKTLKLYINGNLVDTQTYTNAPTGGSSCGTNLMGDQLGEYSPGAFFGYAAVWSSELSAAQLVTLAQAAGMA